MFFSLILFKGDEKKNQESLYVFSQSYVPRLLSSFFLATFAAVLTTWRSNVLRFRLFYIQAEFENI